VAGRARAGHRPPPRGAGGLGVSDLALFSRDSAEQDEYRNLAEVFPHLLGTTRIEAHRPIGVLRETCDAPDVAVDFALRLDLGRLDPGVWEIVLEVVPSGSGLEPL
jgi:hypothetical protein